MRYQIEISENENETNVLGELLGLTGDGMDTIVENAISFYLWAVRACKLERKSVVSIEKSMDTKENRIEFGIYKPVIKGVNDD